MGGAFPNPSFGAVSAAFKSAADEVRLSAEAMAASDALGEKSRQATCDERARCLVIQQNFQRSADAGTITCGRRAGQHLNHGPEIEATDPETAAEAKAR